MSLAREIALHHGLPDRCENCGADALNPIVYGLPTPAVSEAARRGELDLGGCCVGDGAPLWRCRRCHATGGRLTLSQR